MYFSSSGQLQAALARRRSLGRETNLRVNEKVGSGRRKSEPGKIHMGVAEFMRQSLKRIRDREAVKDAGKEEIIETKTSTTVEEHVAKPSEQVRLHIYII